MNPSDPAVINPSNPSPTGGINPTDLMTEIQNRLLGASGAVSSANTKVEDTITSAIDNLKKSNDASKTATGSAFDRSIVDAKTAGANAETSFTEAQRGYATNTAALRDLRTSNEKSVRDLEQRKQEALLSADATTASKISDLILQKYTFEQQATQQVFSNLVSLNNVMLQSAQEKRLAQTQAFTEDQAKQNIALKYGIEVKQGDTLQDVVNRAKPFASKEEQLQLDQAAANLDLTRANAKKALAEAQKAITDKNAANLTPEDFTTFINSSVAANPDETPDTLKAKILKLQGLNGDQRKQAYALVDQYFAKKATQTSTASSSSSAPFNAPIGNVLYNTGVGIGSIGQTVLDFIFGGGSKNDTIYASPFRK